jgi:pyruvate formate lyase activating enzyme
MCFVRQRVGDEMLLTTYGRSSGFCIDPIEKKPLNHFFPGSSVFSFGTAGCNLACKFCQNWDISKSREMDRLLEVASPERIAEAAHASGASSVAFTYNDPVIFAEYAMDTADACHALGLRSVAVTAGYMHATPRREFYARMDAANVDLKGFTEAFYFRQTAEIDAMTRWIADRLGPDVPLHFTAFHPDYKMLDVMPTPPATLTKARTIALGNGLHHVYTGNVHDVEGGTTFCPACHEALVRRDWHAVLSCQIETREDACGTCPHCGTPIAGRFGAFTGAFGRRRIPVRMAVH